MGERVFPPAVLLGGGNIAVSAARSLTGSGVRVHALGTATDPVRHSRLCSEFVDLGAGAGVQRRWLDWLTACHEGAVILPCNDDALELIARNRRRLLEVGHRPIEADDDVLLAMLDKARTHDLAQRTGVPVPHSVVVRNADDAYAASQDFEFPCALKPLQSHLFARHFGLCTKVLVVHCREELVRVLERATALNLDMMLTEIVPGGDDQYVSYYSYLDENGEPLFHFTKRKLRQYPVGFGLACYQVSDRDPEAAELGLRFFQGVGLRGVGNVEFKRDARDGRLKLIECNHRFTAANELVRRCGLDIPLLAYNRLAGRPGPPMSSYRAGVHMWHPIEDLRALVEYRRSGELTVGRWARSLLHRQNFPLLRLDDPWPAAGSLARRARGARRAAAQATRRVDDQRPAGSDLRTA